MFIKKSSFMCMVEVLHDQSEEIKNLRSENKRLKLKDELSNALTSVSSNKLDNAPDDVSSNKPTRKRETIHVIDPNRRELDDDE